VDIEEVGISPYDFLKCGQFGRSAIISKGKQIQWMFEFLTTELGIDPRIYYVTVFAGDPSIQCPQDDDQS